MIINHQMVDLQLKSLARLYGFGAISVFSYDSHKTNLAHFKPILEMLNR